MSKEYLDRKEIEEIFIKAVNYKNSYKFTEKELSNIITQTCKLQPKNQVVLAEGEVNILAKGYASVGIKYIEDELKKYKGKKVKIILEEE